MRPFVLGSADISQEDAMPSSMRLILLCAASTVMLGAAGAALADPDAAARDKAEAQSASESEAPAAGDAKVRPDPRFQFERPAGCPYRDGKLELIV